jgi:branched-chain amino acid aminotransferase
MTAADDRGFLLGDGFFTTMRIEKGRPLLLSRHLRRLSSSACFFGMDVPREDLEQAIREALAGFAEDAGSLRLTVSRGPGPRGLLPPADPKPRITVTLAPQGRRSRAPVRAVVSTIRRNEGSPVTCHKTLGYLDHILARQEAERNEAEEAVMLINSGKAACTTIGNLVLATPEPPYLTPPLAQGGVLPGIVREVLFEAGLLREEPIGRDMLLQHPALRTNSVVGVQPLLIEGFGGRNEAGQRQLAVLTQALEEAEARET